MATRFTLKRKNYSEWGADQLAALREGKAAGYKGKELQDWVKMSVDKTKTGGNMVSLTGAPSKSTTIATTPLKTTADQAFGNVTKTQNNIVTSQAQRAANRTANIANAAGVKDAAMKARTQGFKAGQNSVGIMQGMKNTWGKMGTMGKAGTIAGAAVLTGLAAKGLFGGKKD